MLPFQALILVFSSFLLSYFLTPATIRLCETVGAMDNPDGKRKINTHPTPRLGGLAFFTAFFIIALPAALTNPFIAAILSGGAILVAGGFSDDVFNIPPPLKLIIQASAALVAIAFIGAPESISFFGFFNVSLSGALGVAFAVFKMLFTINAINFSDGLDGLAAGLCAVAFVALSVYGFQNGNASVALYALILSSAVIGFLPYNRYKAKTFMGDAGSQFLGFSIALLSLGCSKNNAYTLETTLFLIIPALDTALSVARRLLKGKSPFVADKGHLHHILLKHGVRHPDAVRLLVLLNAAVAFIALVFYRFSYKSTLV